MRVAVLGVLRFAPSQVREILPYLRALVEATRALDGCIAYDVAEDAFDPGLIRFSELWPSRETLEAHMQAPHIGAWRDAAKACGVLERRFVAFETGASWEF